MSEILITIESKQLPTSTLKELAGIIIPDNNTMQGILLDIIGVTPEKLDITITEVKESEE